jgi:acyl-CoA synthetase (AMP-forming)/AMP-acid ligase II
MSGSGRRWYDSPMGDLLTAHAADQPDKTAVIDDRTGGDLRRTTYAELEDRANQLVHVLHEHGVRPGDKVVWCGQNSTGIVEFVNASRKLGSTSVPLNYRLSDEEAAYVTDHCDATTVYVDAEYAPLFERIRGEIPKVRNVLVFDGDAPDGMVAIDPLVVAAPTATWERPATDDEGGATMTYTSGTTGKPKGAYRRTVADPRAGAALLQHIGYRPDDIYLTTGPLYQSGPGGFMASVIAMGHTVVLQRKFDPQDWLRLLETYRATSTFSAPTPIRMICNLRDEICDRKKDMIISGGMNIYPAEIEAALDNV